MKYYLRTNNGTKNPSFVHSNLQSARQEANRLLENFVCESVEILAIVGKIEFKEIPVTTRKIVEDFTSDLPFCAL